MPDEALVTMAVPSVLVLALLKISPMNTTAWITLRVSTVYFVYLMSITHPKEPRFIEANLMTNTEDPANSGSDFK
jgi:hypothetical protein